jgi:hypothetical protein
MSKKHFAAIAADFRSSHSNARTRGEQIGLEQLAYSIAVTLTGSCPAFDKRRFLDACMSDRNAL